jgi:hypothetical protein
MLLPCLRLAATACLAFAATASHAAEMAIPKVMSDAPLDKGSWRMEMLDMPGKDAATIKAMGGGMTFCSSAAEAVSRDRGPAEAGDKPQCTRKMLEDSAERAVMETTCTGRAMRTMKTTVVRVAPRSYEMSNETTSERRAEPMKTRVRMTYAGPCTAKDAVVQLDSSSPACAQMKGQMAQMDPAKCPTGPNNAQCVERMTMARTQMQSMCK